MRTARIERKTTETEITVEVNLDGTGAGRIETGVEEGEPLPSAHAPQSRLGRITPPQPHRPLLRPSSVQETDYPAGGVGTVPVTTSTVHFGESMSPPQSLLRVLRRQHAHIAMLVSRVTDATGRVQPTAEELESKKTFLEDNSQHPRKVVIA